MRRALAVSLVFALAAHAQTPPPLVPLDDEAPAPVAEPAPTPAPAPAAQPAVAPGAQDPSYFDRCFALPAAAWVPSPAGSGYFYVNPLTNAAPLSAFHAAQPVGSSGSSSSSSSSSSSGSSSGGGGDLGKAVLILAIVLVAVLPIVLYLATDDAPAIVEQRFHCPSFQLDAQGGVDIGFDKVSGVGQTRFTFGWSYFGADFQYEYSGIGQRNLATHVMLRFKPKNFIEPAIAFGYRNIVYGNTVRHGIEVGVPHRYVFWRQGLRSFGLELRPTLFFGLGSLEGGLEGSLVYSVAEFLQVRAGGKVHSFGDQLFGGFIGGASLVF